MSQAPKPTAAEQRLHELLLSASWVDTPTLAVPAATRDSWQGLVDLLTDIFTVPCARIMRVEADAVAVFCCSAGAPAPFERGFRMPLDDTLCGEVLRTGDGWGVGDARAEPPWRQSPEAAAGVAAYLGFPLRWPNGENFGTICIHDTHPQTYGVRHRQRLARFRGVVESQLANLYAVRSTRSGIEGILNHLKDGVLAHDMHRRIFYFNAQAEKITGFSSREVLGRDCHEIFGEPFCGQRCPLLNDHAAFAESAQYMVNITNRSGERRKIDMFSTLMKTNDGNPMGLLATFADVTELFDLRLRVPEKNVFADIIGRDRKMLSVFQQIRDVADYNFPVHIFGETGTGKELVANAIHNESRRQGAPFVPINCGALPETLIESELFGHVKGAFSGAIRDKKGRFELADGGTIFLDEVAELSKLMQVKLLRFLQEGQFEKVGGEKTLAVDVRVISATNKDLLKEVQRKGFREDLYYRLKVIPIHIPPLRERKNDIPLLVDHMLAEFAEERGIRPVKVSDDTQQRLMEYAWPGNVRELQNAIQYALVHSNGQAIQRHDLPLELQQGEFGRRRGPTRKLSPEAVRAALAETGGNKARAARLLGVGRATLYRFLSDGPAGRD